jgi:hypothetical protein
VRQKEIGRSKATCGSSKIEEKVVPKVELYQRGMLKSLMGWTIPFLLASGVSLATSDVGLVLRQLFTRAEDLFDGLFNLTLSNKLIRRQVAERTVRAALIIVEPLGFDDVFGLGHRAEPGYV